MKILSRECPVARCIRYTHLKEHHHLTSEAKSAMSLVSVTTSSLASNSWGPAMELLKFELTRSR